MEGSTQSPHPPNGKNGNKADWRTITGSGGIVAVLLFLHSQLFLPQTLAAADAQTTKALEVKMDKIRQERKDDLSALSSEILRLRIIVDNQNVTLARIEAILDKK